MENNQNQEEYSKGKFNIYTVLLIVMIIGTLYFSFNETTYYNMTVVDKGVSTWIVKKPLVVCKDQTGKIHEFENFNHWIRLKFDNKKLQNEIQIGQTYNITTVGAKVPFGIYYENILNINVSN